MNNQVWRMPALTWAVLAAATAMLVGLYYDGVALMVDWWINREEYGHGILIPFITAFLVWQKKDKLEKTPFTGAWTGTILVAIGVVLFYLGELGGLYTVLQYAFLLAFIGVVYSLTGRRAMRIIAIPLVILLFMLPIPNFLYNDLSNHLQLISSEIGVAVIRAFGISVYLEGNVIDLGTYKLQVVEACSGLRYLFPLMALGFIAAYFFTGAFWKKAIIFLSSIPITVLMNSFRIGLIGVTVEYWGQDMAEGFLHDFEGWVVFMSCVGILIVEMWLLAMIGKDRLPLRQAFGLDFPEPTPKDATVNYRHTPKQLYVSTAIVLLALGSSFFIEERTDQIPERKDFAGFPLVFGEWKGSDRMLEQIYVDKLKLTDYTMIDYRRDGGIPVNFYSAYYESQRKDSTTHSPRACIPGGGWEIMKMEEVEIDHIRVSGQPLKVNRLLIQKNRANQLVYYWFQQRGRVIADELMLKLYFFVDSIERSRTDGALVRLTTFIPPGESIQEADARLQDLAEHISVVLPEYVPD